MSLYERTGWLSETIGEEEARGQVKLGLLDIEHTHVRPSLNLFSFS